MVWEVSIAGKAKTRVTGPGDPAPVSWSGGAYAADGEAFVSTSDAGGEFKQLVRVSLPGGEATPLTAPLAWDVDDFAVTRDRRQLAAVANEGGTSRLHIYDMTTGRERPRCDADRIRCAIDIVGISNFVTFLEHTEAYRRDLRRVEYGDERDPKMRAFLQKISPLTQAERITKPLFVIQGRNDPRVPVSEAEQMVATLKERSTPAWYLEGKDEGHGFNKKRNQDYQMYATIQFMRAYLLDGMQWSRPVVGGGCGHRARLAAACATRVVGSRRSAPARGSPGNNGLWVGVASAELVRAGACGRSLHRLQVSI